MYGSSPRAWGTQFKGCSVGCHCRFIPTCVGNTGRTCISSCARPVHPHVRGEHLRYFLRYDGTDGSSPRAWGTPVRDTLQRSLLRFIPTCVGNTRSAGSPATICSVHPHVRGEHTLAASTTDAKGGSSPRAWGTLSTALCGLCSARFIPTCVGNTLSIHRSQSFGAVHPHVRGEHENGFGSRGSLDGSSPRAWGTPITTLLKTNIERFIPTCVGNTRKAQTQRHQRAVHPHVRGEHTKKGWPHLHIVGSSPRAWGTRPRTTRKSSVLRFIPTCVGNTRDMRKSVQVGAVHPHVRGEHRNEPGEILARVGSSPRAWGTLVGAFCVMDGRRFIPTCVGNTWGPWKRGRQTTVHPHVRGEHSSEKLLISRFNFDVKEPTG